MEPTMEAGLEPTGGMKAVPGPVVQIDEGRIQAHLDEVVRATVEETLNGLLDAEADRLCQWRLNNPQFLAFENSSVWNWVDVLG